MSSRPSEPREGVCDVCRCAYPVWFAPNALWNKIMRRADGSDIYPFICLNCFAHIAENEGHKPTAWMLVEEPWDDEIRKAYSLP